MGLTPLAALAAALALVGAGPVQDATRYLEARQAADGGFAEPGRAADVSTTAWAMLALAAAGAPADDLRQAAAFVAAHQGGLDDAGAALAALALGAAGDVPEALLQRLRSFRPGPLVNATIWTMIALRQAGEPVPAELVRSLRAAQARTGGWSWTARGAPDSNDTAAAIEALRAVGVAGPPIRRGLAFLRSLRNRDGGFPLTKGRPSDAQSTAWAIQAFLAAAAETPTGAVRFLGRLRRADGSYRYSAAYATTPVWVTAQVLPALVGRPFPL